MSLTVGSLFAGIGGFDLGFERAGFEIKWQVEIDDYANRVLEKHWPYVRRHRDVRTVHGGWPGHVCDHCLEPVDVIVGGFPCQDISVAGAGAGIDGERSGLWSQYARLVRVLRPRYVVVENVAALLGRGLGRVLGDLAESGYDAEWDCLPASAFGAPHRRDRLWLVAYTRCGGWESRRAGWREAVGGRPHAYASRSGNHSGALAYADRQRQLQPEGRELDERRRIGDGGPRIFSNSDRESLGRIAESRGQRGQWLTEPDVGRVADGIPARAHRLRGLGNAIVPQIAEWIARRIAEAEGLT